MKDGAMLLEDDVITDAGRSEKLRSSSAKIKIEGRGWLSRQASLMRTFM